MKPQRSHQPLLWLSGNRAFSSGAGSACSLSTDRAGTVFGSCMEALDLWLPTKPTRDYHVQGEPVRRAYHHHCSRFQMGKQVQGGVLPRSALLASGEAGTGAQLRQTDTQG